MDRAPRPLTDSHAHLDDRTFGDDLEQVIARARQANVQRTIVIATELDSALRCREIAREHDGLWSTAGVHPHEAGRFDRARWGDLEALWAEGDVRAVGETGLDYHYTFSEPAQQRELFVRHLEAGARYGLPLVIHVREAFDDAFELLGQADLRPGGGVLHCFTGGPREAEIALDLGLHISIAGIVTFNNADALREAVKGVPAPRLLVETDAPYLAPKPHRGRRNEPAMVVHTARRVAEVRGCDLAELCDQTWTNTERLFGLHRP